MNQWINQRKTEVLKRGFLSLSYELHKCKQLNNDCAQKADNNIGLIFCSSFIILEYFKICFKANVRMHKISRFFFRDRGTRHVFKVLWPEKGNTNKLL